MLSPFRRIGERTGHYRKSESIPLYINIAIDTEYSTDFKLRKRAEDNVIFNK